jgi:succinate dehydrogenase / fumarate reductase, flavoprotein subunit
MELRAKIPAGPLAEKWDRHRFEMRLVNPANKRRHTVLVVGGLHVLGEANFSDHGANRLGASALMQGLADGYFIIPVTIGDYLAGAKLEKVSPDHPEVRGGRERVHQKTARLLSIDGARTVDSFHRELGLLMWDKCGMARNARGLREALDRIPEIRAEFWENVTVPGSGAELNQALEKANPVADFLEFAELMCLDALHREESCGGHFREEHQTPDGEAKRDDEGFAYVAAWEYAGENAAPVLHREPLVFENVQLAQRSYK